MRLKVVVIDDKPLIREAIIKTIKWDDLGCDVVGQAADGIEGKKIIIEQKPDIIITDIKMPGLDGLELTEFINPILPDSRTIVITGYQDFDYAKRAVKLGVYDFILKPIKNEELFNVIRSAANEIIKDRNEKTAQKMLADEKVKFEQQYNDTLPSLREKLVIDIINGSAGTEDSIRAGLKMLKLEAVRHMTLVVRMKSQNEREGINFYNALSEIAEAVKVRHDIDLVNTVINRDYVFVMLFDRAISVREARMRMKSFYTDIDNSLSKKTINSYTGAASSLYKSLVYLKDSYREAVELMNTNFFKVEKRLLLADDSGKIKTPGKASIINDLERFYTIFETLDNEETDRQIRELLENIAAYSSENIFIAKSLLSEICITAARYYYKAVGNNEAELNKSVDMMLDDIDKLEDINQASKYIKDYIGSIKERLKKDNRKYSPVIKKVIEYINTYFSEEISLEGVADSFAINPSYLSRLLKKETGANFVEILTKTRLEVAKRLLRDPANKVNEVAERVGYKDYTYFYQVFKKVEGISPSEFKKMM